MTFDAKILPLGDSALSVQLGEEISPEVNSRVLALDEALRQHPPPGFIETVPSYRAVAVYYDLLLSNEPEVREHIYELVKQLDDFRITRRQSRTAYVPISYGGELGPDFSEVCRILKMSAADFVKAHTAVEYRIYMLGFAPGHASMGVTPTRLRMPRRLSPRTRTEKGSVGIGGQQCGIYSLTGPAGFWIIGRTPLELYRPTLNPPALLRPGDAVRFRSIDAPEFADIRAAVAAGAFDAFTCLDRGPMR